MGAVMRAVIEAQIQAAESTVEFVEGVGFSDPGEAPHRLRMVQFKYSKLDENQTENEFVAEIPLLGMVDIPVISVKRAKFSFNYEVTQTGVETHSGPRIPTRLPASRSYIMGRVAKEPRTSSQEKHERADLHIEVELEKSPLPASLDQVMDILELAAKEDKVDERKK